MKKKILAFVVMASIFLVGFIATTAQPVDAQPSFVVATWDNPDQYGQGISTWYLQTNTSGTWATVEASGYLDADPSPVAWNASDPVRVLTWVSLNYSLCGAISLENGKNYVMQKVNVTDSSDTLMFSEVNGTYIQGIENEGLYWYQYGFVWDFLPVSGEVYSIAIYYWVYY